MSSTNVATPEFTDISLTSVASNPMVSYLNGNGITSFAQPSIALKRVGWAIAEGAGGTNIFKMGLNGGTAGSVSNPGLASTSIYTTMQRSNITSGAGAGSSCGFNGAQTLFFRGNAARKGGWLLAMRWAAGDAAAVSGARSFNGMYGSGSTIGNVEPSSLANTAGFGNDTADTNLQFIYNDASGTASKIDLGASFPATTISTDIFLGVIFAPSNGSSISFDIWNQTTGVQFIGTRTVDTNLIVNTQGCAPHMWRNNAATALAVTLSFSQMYVEQEY